MTRILIRATNWVGDAVMSLPAVRAVREQSPSAYIAILGRPWIEDLYARESVCDRFIPYTPKAGGGDLVAKWKLGRQLAKEKFDRAILLPNSFESALIVKLAGISRIIGYNRDGRGWLLTSSIPMPETAPRHQRFYYLDLIRRAGLIGAAPDRIFLTRDIAAGTTLLAARGVELPVIGVSPGAAYGNAKRWLPERFAESAVEVADFLNARVAIFGSAGERDLCETVARAIGPRAYNLAGETSLREFIDMTAACRVLLTNDSGAMHIASALGVPTVTVFGATNDVTTGPTGNLARIVREPVECSPCLLRECPIDHRCMTGVSTARVTATALEVLR